MGMAIVTYLPRMLPLTILSKREIPEILKTFLAYIPAAILSALFFSSIIIAEDKINISLSNPLFMTSLITLPIALKYRNMFVTVLMGMGIMVLVNVII